MAPKECRQLKTMRLWMRSSMCRTQFRISARS
jgi:hypothetical protein